MIRLGIEGVWRSKPWVIYHVMKLDGDCNCRKRLSPLSYLMYQATLIFMFLEFTGPLTHSKSLYYTLLDVDSKF